MTKINAPTNSGVSYYNPYNFSMRRLLRLQFIFWSSIVEISATQCNIWLVSKIEKCTSDYSAAVHVEVSRSSSRKADHKPMRLIVGPSACFHRKRVPLALTVDKTPFNLAKLRRLWNLWVSRTRAVRGYSIIHFAASSTFVFFFQFKLGIHVSLI